LDRSSFAAAPLLIALVFGCARPGEAASPPSQTPEQPAGEQPAPNGGAAAPTSLEGDEGPALTTIEAAEAEFARVERQLDGLWAEGERPEAKGSDDLALRCETACKAFLSLERAAVAICRLGGDADSRCTLARRTVEKNRQRISECACS
jgi:hypothetical protein